MGWGYNSVFLLGYNFSHRIQKLAFGPRVVGMMNPLDGTEEVSDDRKYTFWIFVLVSRFLTLAFFQNFNCINITLKSFRRRFIANSHPPSIRANILWASVTGSSIILAVLTACRAFLSSTNWMQSTWTSTKRIGRISNSSYVSARSWEEYSLRQVRNVLYIEFFTGQDLFNSLERVVELCRDRILGQWPYKVEIPFFLSRFGFAPSSAE